jgi:cobalt/nickel transport system permease protein
MSHIHLPDGVLPPVWWISAYIVCFIIIWLLVRRLKGDEVRRKIPYAGVMGALMLIFMSVPLGVIPVHLSLAVLSGILAGPSLGFIAAFVVNIFLAFMGHGGITVVGINTLILGSEVILGYYIFQALSRKLGNTSSAVLSTILALLVSTVLMIGVVGTTVGLAEALPGSGHHHEVTEDIINDSTTIDGAHHNEDQHLHDAAASVSYLSFSGWTAIAIILLLGIFIESLVTGFIVRFFSRVRPDFIQVV